MGQEKNWPYKKGYLEMLKTHWYLYNSWKSRSWPNIRHRISLKRFLRRFKGRGWMPRTPLPLRIIQTCYLNSTPKVVYSPPTTFYSNTCGQIVQTHVYIVVTECVSVTIFIITWLGCCLMNVNTLHFLFISVLQFLSI